MAAKKKRKSVAPQQPKKRVGGPVKKKKAGTKPEAQAAADILDNAPAPPADAEARPQPFRAEAPPPPYRPLADNNMSPTFPPSQSPSMHWGNNSFEAAAQVIAISQQIRDAASLATRGAVQPPLPLTAGSLVTSSREFGSPAFGQNHHLTASDPKALHAEMIERIESLEREIDNLREQQRHGIGHNKPPEPIELAPLTARELNEIKEDMAVLKKQPPTDPPSTEATAAVAQLLKFARTAVVYAGKKADIFITAAVTRAGEKIIWSPIIYKLWALADIAHQWLQSLPYP
jgi:hypothetical protein